MGINLTPAHNTNKTECLIFAAEIPKKHSFLIRCNRKGGETSAYPDFSTSLPYLHVTILALAGSPSVHY